MPIGIIINVLSVVLGGLTGAIVGNRLSPKVKEEMNLIFGICAMGMGMGSVCLMQNMPAVVFSVIVGSFIGLSLKIGQRIQTLTGKALKHLLKNSNAENEDMMLTAVVLFCVSGTGIYGSLESGMTGNHSILIAKAVLDFFTAMIFACKLGKITALIGVPQFVIMIALFFLAKVIVPLTTDMMIADFKACGGLILLATGLRMLQLKPSPIADMIPAMILVMPISYAWTTWLQPLFG